ncbi:putative unspecific monooxygenase [Legionella lansingensis]|uniref:Cytochrome P450 n=1 Tax=Legionella lansingensis TaxID=45067 RepID=A0A0W0VV31_9GAMM|nr:cytochrome P450 [Legionella lansingensis]KTD23906.1 Cytochrome P450 [Legionella lansingensis]SNV46365.1 putative unspecific monooxygenase [Legionella lansingensis]
MFGDLFKSSIMLSIQYYSSQTYQAAVGFLGQMERFGFGYTREFFHDPKSMIQTLTSNARSSEAGYSVVSLGYLGGNYAVITPKSQSQLVELLNQFDKEKSGRRGHASFKFFSGNEFFIISDTGHNAMSSRKNLSRFLTPSRLVNPTITEIEKSVDSDTDIQIRHAVCGIVRAVMVENMLSIKQLPDNTYNVMESYRNDVKRWGAFPFPELLNFMPSLRQKRDAYRTFSRGILEQEFEKLVEVLHTDEHPGNTNLIAASVVGLFRDENPDLSDGELSSAIKSLSTEEIRRYFENPIVQSLPMILKAADNLTDAIVLCLLQIASDPSKLEILRDEIDRSNLVIEEGLDVRALKSLPILDAFYKESVRFDAPVVVPRYTQSGYSSDSMTIPPNTMVIFDLQALSRGEQYWTNPEEFDPTRFLQPEQKHVAEEEGTSAKNNRHIVGQFPFVPFSVGLRNCPAFAVTEALFKVAIAKFVSNYDLQFVKKGDDDSTLHVTSRDKFFGTMLT